MTILLTRDTSANTPYPSCRLSDVHQLDSIHFWGGVSLKGKFPQLTVFAEDDPNSPSGLTDFIGTIHLNFVSEKLKDALLKANAEVEFFPATVIYNNKKIPESFYAINSLHRIKALDLPNSDVEIDDELGDVLVARKIRIDDSKIEKYNWLIIDEINRIAVSKHLMHGIQQSGCSGCSFMDSSNLRY